MMNFIVAFALATSPPALGVSQLADPGHQHDWVEFANEDDGAGWFDLNWDVNTDDGGKEIPTVLVRFIATEGGVAVEGDVLFAVRCDLGEIAVAAGTARYVESGDIVEQRPEKLVFDFAEKPYDDNDVAVFRRACGQDWQP